MGGGAGHCLQRVLQAVPQLLDVQVGGAGRRGRGGGAARQDRAACMPLRHCGGISAGLLRRTGGDASRLRWPALAATRTGSALRSAER
jgi:hypothetical protein